MSFKISTALVILSIAISACAQQEEPVIMEIQPEPTSTKLG